MAALYFLWATLLTGSLGGTLTREQMLGYYALALLLRWLFGFRSVTERFEKVIFEGELVNFLVRPLPLGAMELGRVAAQWFVNSVLLLLVFVPIVSALGWITPTVPSLTGLAALLLIGALIQYHIYSLIGTFGFWLEKVFGIVYGFDLVMLLATGTLLPLDLYPPAIARLLNALPFRFFVYVPVQALRLPVTWPWVESEVVSGFAWVLGLGLLTSYTWRRGLRRFTGHGV
ncbi:MAG: ABC-2 family transporter protein [Bacillota bacterium]